MNRTTFLMATCSLLVCAPLGLAADNELPEKARAILDKADVWELRSLDPAVENFAAKDGGYFGWKVLGKTEIKDAALRKEVRAVLDKGLADGGKYGAKCFDPRHGIRATHDGKSVDLVICFECSWIYVHYDGKTERADTLIVTRNPQKLFDKILTDAKVPLPKPARQ